MYNDRVQLWPSGYVSDLLGMLVVFSAFVAVFINQKEYKVKMFCYAGIIIHNINFLAMQ